MTPMFGAHQIPMMSRPVNTQQANSTSYQQANLSSNGGRVIPIQIESKVLKIMGQFPVDPKGNK